MQSIDRCAGNSFGGAASVALLCASLSWSSGNLQGSLGLICGSRGHIRCAAAAFFACHIQLKLKLFGLQSSQALLAIFATLSHQWSTT